MFTNRNSHSDFAISAIERFGRQSSVVKIAVPFFTDIGTVEWLATKGCQVRLIVRLGFPTSADALRELLRNEKVQVRFFTDPAFHSKLYVFGDHTALIGSANLTGRALRTNQEILVTVYSNDHRFDELAVLFSEYWDDAKVLTEEELKTYEYLCRKYDRASSGILQLEQDIIKGLGRVTSKNITRDKTKGTEEDAYIDDYRKTFQETVSAFNEVRGLYESTGKRKVSPDTIPIRLEVDSFISFVREKHAQGDSWADVPILNTVAERSSKILPLISEWYDTEWKWFESHIVKEGYPLLKSIFESAESVKAATDDNLFDSLCVIHSFLERRRFYRGGLPNLRVAFFSKNDRDSINRNLSYLIFGRDETVRRMCNLIFGAGHKLNHFGRSNVQELIGWINHEELPVINGRTTKVLRYFGFDVRQCQ